ncbi:MAG: Uma2 family endonuclease [Verrucomicrobiales bacterium]|nr:Uma2 family endonuclease [Verrucomicrobiales bacterium]
MSTATLQRSKTGNAGRRSRIAPLRNGEHLSRAEFERRWDATPGLTHAELIEGIVFMPPPISDDHGNSHSLVFRYLDRYAEATPGVISRINTSLRLDNRNEYQPDCLLRLKSPKFGHSWISPDNYIEGAPELVAEVAVSSADYDAHEKRDVYERMGVQEYLLWQVLDSRFDWLTLQDGQYVSLKPRADGVYRSLVFPGLWLDSPALLAGDENKVRKTLERGLRSAEHTAFVKRLATAR